MPEEDPPPLTRKRWLVLFVVVLLNVSNAILWLSYASVFNVVAQTYSAVEKDIDYFSLVFCIATVVAGLLVVWIVDKNGLRIAILVGAFLNALGAVIRMLSTLIKYENGYLYEVAMVGQVFAALAQPFLYCVPTKVAEQWFPDNQRALATSLGVMANLAGQLIACGVTPIFVKSSDDVKYMNIYYAVPCLVAAVLTAFSIRSSKPEVPPSNSAAIFTNYPYFSALKTFFSRKESVFLLLGVGSVLGVSYTLMSRMEEILCAKGHSNVFSGQCTMCLMCCGLLGAVLASVVADKTRSFIPIIKICLTFMVVALCLFIITVILKDHVPNALIFVACGLVGFWGYAAFPVGLELAVEHSFTVLPEATTSGLILITGQLLSIIYFVFFETLAVEDKFASPGACHKHTSKLADQPHVIAQDNSCPLYVLAGITTFLVGLFLLFFKSDYNRMKTENRSMSAIINDDDPIMHSTSFEDPSWHTSIYS